ncbi:hypothetical protein EGW08_000111 [Elysia chlorotica]|uniref:Uncharacterized protein n=1 Tax=Elysia chlorotica TaxID=188477 RepID=A0A3S1BVE2_ELYCH|nr:hypothetical protein EGW08_000111 [Elysia chlorotica]
MDYINLYYTDTGISRRPRPRSLCARCGGIAQDELLSTRPKSSDRGPCKLSIEVDGREGRQDRRRHSSTGRDANRRSDNPLCFVVATENGKKAAGTVTTYRESFRSPPPDFKSRTIRSLPSSPITATGTSSRTKKNALARQMTDQSDIIPSNRTNSDGSPPPLKQTDCSASLISLLNNENGQGIPRPAKGRGNTSAAAKGKAHQPLWSDKTDMPNPPLSTRRSAKGFAHQPLWSDGNETPAPAPTPRKNVKGLAHQPLWTDAGDVPTPAPTSRGPAKGLSHQPLWADTAPDPGPVRPSARATHRSVSESAALPAAGVKTQPPSSFSNYSLTSWLS